MTERPDNTQQPDQPLTQEQIDKRDLSAEIDSGGAGNKMSRFLIGERDPALLKKKEDDRRKEQIRTALQTLATQQQVDDARDALFDLQDRLDNAFSLLEDMRDDLDERTVRLADGRAVYLMEDGQFATEDGTVIHPGLLPDDIPENAATLDERRAYVERAGQLATIQSDVIDSGLEKLSKDDVTVSEVEEIENSITQSLRVIEGDIGPSQDEAPNKTPEPQAGFNPALNAPAF
ncbi:MAG: hypothetical protein AAGI89_02025 [Pseudomonadota bacterium]